MDIKYVTTAESNKFTSNTLDSKIPLENLVNESDLNEMIKTLATNEEIKTSESKAEQDEIAKLQIFDSSLFIGQSYFDNDGIQLYLVFQPTYKTITAFSGLTSTTLEWESKGLSNERFTPPYKANKSLSPKLIWN